MIRRIELKRDFQKHRDAYLAAIRTCCEESAFSGGKYAEQFERQFAEYIGKDLKATIYKTNGSSQEKIFTWTGYKFK